MSYEKSITACFTGHRQIPAEEEEKISVRLDEVIADLIGQGIECFAAGGALGFDTMAAQAVLRAKEAHPEIRLILVLPFPDQGRRWAEQNRRIYEEIKTQADEIKYASEHYTRFCMFARNRQLVERSCVCVAYQTKDTGGTAYTVKYARSKGLRIINLADN